MDRESFCCCIPAINRERIVVLVKNATHREKVHVDASFVTLRGQSRSKTRIEFPQLKDDVIAHPDDIGWAVINLNHANDSSCAIATSTVRRSDRRARPL
jgi:pectin methylesterase-like acyl-CoA thioesterase